MSENTTKTVHHVKGELQRALNIPFVVDPFSTLNEKFANATINAAVPDGEYPTIGYITIGRGGHRNRTGTGGASLLDILKHRPSDAVLFDHVPFLMREVGSDITHAERERYRMRTRVTYNSVDYMCYWVRVVDVSAAAPETRIVTVLDGVSTEEEYIAGSSSQSPTEIVIDNDNLNTADGRYLVTQSNIGLTLDESDINEIINACEIIYGDAAYATISEVGLVSGFDLNITNNLDGVGDITYTEITHAQIINFIGTQIPLQHRPDSAVLDYGLANTMPYPIVE